MIAAVRVIKDPGADNDGSTHAEKRDKASQYPEHLRASQGLLFFQTLLNAAIVSIAVPSLCTACQSLAMTFSRITVI